MNGALLATATANKSGSTVTALVNGISTTVQVARDLTVASGDVVVVQRVGAQWFAFARAYSAAPAATDPEGSPQPKPSVTTGTLVVSPVETRSYRSSYGWRTDNTDVYQGEYGGWGNHIGAVFYGSKPRSLDGATVTDARIRVRRISAGTYAAQSTSMRLMTEATRPSGSPTLTSSSAGPSLAVGATASAFDIPTSWAQAFVNGTAGGIAFYDSDGSPYVRFAGRGSWSPAFTLTITWRR
ncbi:hypothetical protein O7626_31360 [Micromonospora sp. WMMD1102]|uniref:hypothetical protein n=1 Tax=Micromonospora sp. WMMD1102 TaxID=3016105 RepID=UPI0024156181|nr:hypothetical protein [Micromonospora sp. WMMD1102]MDG4790367.1 hypothetical protein [Micromonospora sp. WMMD1102]